MHHPCAPPPRGCFPQHRPTNTKLRSGQELRIPRPITPGILLAITFGTLLTTLLAGCTHRATLPTEGASSLHGHVQMVVAPSLGLRQPRRTQQANIKVAFWGVVASADREIFVETRTDHRGYFRIQGLEPGTYRLATLRGLWVETYSRILEPDLVFSTGGKQLNLGMNGLRMTARKSKPVPNLELELAPGETHAMGDLEVRFQRDPFSSKEGCIHREVMIPGVTGSAWYFNGPIFAQLCITQENGETSAHTPALTPASSDAPNTPGLRPIGHIPGPADVLCLRETRKEARCDGGPP